MTGLLKDSLNWSVRKTHMERRFEFLKMKGEAKSLSEEVPSSRDDGQSQSEKATLDIAGMHCASCALNLEVSLQKVDGVSKAAVNFATEKAYVEYDPSKASPKALEEAVKA